MAPRGDYPSSKQDQFVLRLPDGMREQLKADAAANGRSLNSEIVARLSADQRSLRDWFAGQMMARIATGWPNEQNRDLLAKQAYQMADAMLKAREATQ